MPYISDYLYLQKHILTNRYFIFLSFKGTRYHGWQRQQKSTTVQKILEEALSIILNEKIVLTGAGRTDAGVHALVFCAHFDSQKEDLHSNNRLIQRLNKYLPVDIAIKQIRKVIPEANARFSAISRTYQYFLSYVKDPFKTETSWFINYRLKIEIMNKACEILAQTDDFASFCKLHSDNKTTICKVYHACWTEVDDILVFTIKADRFLRNMVRAIVGTMIYAGKGKISLSDFARIIQSRDRSESGMSAPAKGLFLTDIEYPENIFI